MEGATTHSRLRVAVSKYYSTRTRPVPVKLLPVPVPAGTVTVNPRVYGYTRTALIETQFKRSVYDKDFKVKPGSLLVKER